jgi:CBS domain-containing protein
VLAGGNRFIAGLGVSDFRLSKVEVMTLQRIRHLPIVENGELHGIVSIGDVVKQRLEEVQSEAEELRSYIRSP